jgi:hypothetical protein
VQEVPLPYLEDAGMNHTCLSILNDLPIQANTLLRDQATTLTPARRETSGYEDINNMLSGLYAIFRELFRKSLLLESTDEGCFRGQCIFLPKQGADDFSGKLHLCIPRVHGSILGARLDFLDFYRP